MARDYAREAFEDAEKNQVRQQWYEARRDAIHRAVSAYDVLARFGVSLKRAGDREEQISCPFHGTDRHPSAKFYPDTTTSKSHVWCFVCREPGWDAIGLWRKFSGDSYPTALFRLEQMFGISPPEFHVSTTWEEDEYDPAREEVENLLETCEQRLIRDRDSFDMTSHLKLGAILDQIRFQIDRGEIRLPEAKTRLQLVLGKIGQKVRASATDIADRGDGTA